MCWHVMGWTARRLKPKSKTSEINDVLTVEYPRNWIRNPLFSLRINKMLRLLPCRLRKRFSTKQCLNYCYFDCFLWSIINQNIARLKMMIHKNVMPLIKKLLQNSPRVSLNIYTSAESSVVFSLRCRPQQKRVSAGVYTVSYVVLGYLIFICQSTVVSHTTCTNKQHVVWQQAWCSWLTFIARACRRSNKHASAALLTL
jgi:hypothetical protein